MTMVQDVARWLSAPFAPGPTRGAPPTPAVEAPAKFAARIVVGVASGAVATLAMSAAMEVSYRLLSPSERGPLAPSQIVMRGAAAAGVDTRAHPVRHTLITLLAHFGYGSAAGVGYTLLMSRTPLPPPFRGLLYGAALWAVSYQAWLPSTGVLRPATTYARGRVTTLVVSHLVWGAAADVTERLLAARMGLA